MSDQNAPKRYIVKLRSPVDDAEQGKVAKNVAVATQMPDDKAHKMVSRPPGNLTRATTEDRAKQLAKNLRAAGMDVVVVNQDAPDEPVDVWPEGPEQAIPKPPVDESPAPGRRPRQARPQTPPSETQNTADESPQPAQQRSARSTKDTASDIPARRSQRERDLSANVLWQDNTPGASPSSSGGAGAQASNANRTSFALLGWLIAGLVVAYLAVAALAYFVPNFPVTLNTISFGLLSDRSRETVPDVPNTRPSPADDESVDARVAPLPDIEGGSAGGGTATERDDVPIPTNIFTAAREATPAQIDALAAQGADVNDADAFGQTPLIYAVNNDDPEVLRALINAGANVNTQTGAGWTPLMYAARDGTLAMVQILLDEGANPNLTNSEGDTALDIARQTPDRQDVITLLQQAG